ncbi:hypothetical protein [Bacillus sp. AFS088145]|uniref:hypothetical protein n=1 Tax=Bacillus sp. AFS088145 TaxID=2033514 RepID=UPI000BF9F36F|nr:hypothetical protein [Bacillus sp. AFS088145]PFH81625.1 hypothetical protein COI44_22885 [Bacillus sp. AFS088145]
MENYNLPSYQEYVEHSNRVSSQMENLEQEISQVKQEMLETERQYANSFGTGVQNDEIVNRLNELKQKEASLLNQKSILDSSDLRRKDLASTLYQQFQETERNAIDTRNGVITSAQELIESTKQRLKELQEVYDRQATTFHSQAGRQMLSALECLDVREDLKDSIRLRMQHLGVAERFPSIG